MNTRIINFREERDFSQKLNVTFGFIRQNFSKLLKCMLFFVVPFALIGGILMGVVQARIAQAASGDLYYRPWGEYGFFQNVTSINYLASMFFTYLGFILIGLSIYGYMVLYMDNDGEVEVRDVWESIKHNFLTTFYSSFGILIFCMLGFILLIIPGIYLSVALSLFLIIMVREDVGFVESIERSLHLIKGNWWPTLGLLLMVGIIQGMISMIGYMPVFVLYILKLLNLPGGENSVLIIVANTLATIIGMVLYVLSITAIAFQYFHLVEVKDGIGLMQQADLIGQPEGQKQGEDASY